MREDEYDVYTQNPDGSVLSEERSADVKTLMEHHILRHLKDTPESYYKYFDKVLFDKGTVKFMTPEDWCTGVKLLKTNGVIYVDLEAYKELMPTLSLVMDGDDAANPKEKLLSSYFLSDVISSGCANPLTALSGRVGFRSLFCKSGSCGPLRMTYENSCSENMQRVAQLNKFLQDNSETISSVLLEKCVLNRDYTYDKFTQEVNQNWERLARQLTPDGLEKYLLERLEIKVKVSVISEGDDEKQQEIYRLYQKIFPSEQIEGILDHPHKWIKITKE